MKPNAAVVLKWASLAIFSLALLLRVMALVLTPTGPDGLARSEQFPDQREYLALGRSVYQSHALTFVDPRFNQPTVAFRMPVYPAMIAALQGKARAVQWMQAVFGALTVFGVMALAKRVGGHRLVPVIAGVLAAINPLSIAAGVLILTETLTAFVLVWVLVGLTSQGTKARWAAVFTASGLALVSPQWAAFGFVATVLAARLWPVRPRVRLAAVAVSLLTTVMVLVPWAARNRILLGEWLPLTTAGGQTLLDGFGPQADGSSNLGPVIDAMPQLGALGELERHHLLTAEAVDEIRAHPLRLPLLAAAKVARTFSPLPLSAGTRGAATDGKLNLASLAMGVICGTTLFLAGTTVLTGGVSQKAGLVVVAALYVALVAAVSVGSMRYRAAIEPALAVPAGLAVLRLIPRRVT